MRIFLKIITAFLLILMLTVVTHAAEYEFDSKTDGEIYPREEFDSLYESLPDDVKDELADFMAAENDGDRTESLQDKLDVKYWLRYVAEELREQLQPAGVGFVGLLGIVILASILKNMLDVSLSNRMQSLGIYVLTLVVAATVASMSLTAIKVASDFITRICTMMNAMLPVMNALLISSGSLTQMGVNSTALMLYITVTENLMHTIFIPLSGALFALSTMSGVLRGINIGSFIGAMRRVMMRILSFSLMIFSFVLGIQTSLAGSADSLGMKTVRFALGNYVPIVGGAVSEAIGTVRAGLAHVKIMTGTFGIIVILLIVLPSLVSLILSRITLSLCHSVAELLECGPVSRILSEADSVLSVFLALCAMTAVFFVFAVVLFMNTGVSM